MRAAGGSDLAIIERPGRKRITVEVSCRSRKQANDLQRRFGGHFKKLSREWLKRLSREQRTTPLRIGKRLVVSNVEGTSEPRRRSHTARLGRPPSSDYGAAGQGPSHIVIPAGAAFGTGQHATTAMSLRLLEQLTRAWKPGWSLVDLGTGSGIFALAAKCLGAGTILAIDNDPIAISTAKSNARLNRVSGIDLAVADVRKWRLPARVDVVTANLFSELLIEVLPKLKRVRWLVLSGIMRNQERGIRIALRTNGFEISTVRRRGKWIAMLVSRCTRSGDL